ncbi:hypothetical protein ABEF93_001538 [Exophiala dermatitidis]
MPESLMARVRSIHIEQVLKKHAINWSNLEQQRKRVNALMHSWRVEEFTKCRNSDDPGVIKIMIGSIPIDIQYHDG